MQAPRLTTHVNLTGPSSGVLPPLFPECVTVSYAGSAIDSGRLGLITNARFPALTHINLYNLSDRNVIELSDDILLPSPVLPRVHNLILRFLDVSDAFLSTLLTPERFPNLRTLELTSWRLLRLPSHFRFSQVTHLQVSDRFENFHELPEIFPNLRSLTIVRVQPPYEPIDLSRLPHLEALETDRERVYRNYFLILPVIDFTFLQRYTSQLEELRFLDSTNLSDLSLLNGMKNLRVLTLREIPPSSDASLDFAAVARSLTSLEDFECRNWPFASLEVFDSAARSRLRRIAMHRADAARGDWSNVHLPNIEEFSFKNNNAHHGYQLRIDRLPRFGPNLRKLELDLIDQTLDASDLIGLENLETLHISSTFDYSQPLPRPALRVDWGVFVANQRNLAELFLNLPGIDDVTFDFKNLEKLESVHFDWAVGKVEFDGSYPSLRLVDVSRAREVTGVASLPRSVVSTVREGIAKRKRKEEQEEAERAALRQTRRRRRDD